MDWITKLSSEPAVIPKKKNISERLECNATKPTKPILETDGDIEHRPSKSENNTWIQDHASELKAAGFSKQDIHGEGWYPGIADPLLWSKKNLDAQLKGNTIIFTWPNQTGQKITQTCRPTSWHKPRGKNEN